MLLKMDTGGKNCTAKKIDQNFELEQYLTEADRVNAPFSGPEPIICPFWHKKTDRD